MCRCADPCAHNRRCLELCHGECEWGGRCPLEDEDDEDPAEMGERDEECANG